MPMSRLPLTLAAAAALCFSAGCSKKEMHKKESKQPLPASARSSADPRCPMFVPGTQVQTQDTSDGVALMFTTSDLSQVTDLQARARRMLNEQSKATSAQTPLDLAQEEDLGDSPTEIQSGRDESGTGGGGEQGMAGVPMVPAKVVATDTPNGITLTYSAQDPMQKRQLIDEVHETARQLKGGHCPGM